MTSNNMESGPIISSFDLAIAIISAVFLTTAVVVITFMAAYALIPKQTIWPYLTLEWVVIFIPVLWIYYRNAKNDADSTFRFEGQFLALAGRFGSDPELEIDGFEHRINLVTKNGAAKVSRIESIGAKGSSTTQLRVVFEVVSDERFWVEKREIASNLLSAIKGRPTDLLPFSGHPLDERFLLFSNNRSGEPFLTDAAVIQEIARLSGIEGLYGLRVYLDGKCLRIDATFASRRRPGVVNPLSLKYLEPMLTSGTALISVLRSRRSV